ncbi:hypothetical protein [Curtobacterium sp. BRD11]|uniref:hypothetical protein n=1 Tax=Curtobacterium sp. BRD11 TaxID=2962581 RepID=UPI002881EDC5|nr:hypothetical protein [Curtobacterium sp. BRD11]MDT0209036.1 hypothetical protein [Curtobacterium sp. BRD11]
MHDVYDWLKDIGLPTLVGVGSIAVGLVAALVARQSHNLAVQVRKDEAKRDEFAARERYRDQLFRTVEPAIALVMDLRTALITGDQNAFQTRGAHAAVFARLSFISAIANEDDRAVSEAAIDRYEAAAQTSDKEALKRALIAIALALPRLCAADRDPTGLVLALKDSESTSAAD